MSYLHWLSMTAPAVWARESDSVWAYPTILFLHTFGLALLVGFTTAIDFRMLGFSPSLPLAPMGRFFRYVWIGFWINAVSGMWLLIMTPAKLWNPAFPTKMACIGLGVLIMLWMKRTVFRASPGSDEAPAVSTLGRAMAAASLLLWVGAIVAGRLMAYVGTTK